jgi:hypothetical protein
MVRSLDPLVDEVSPARIMPVLGMIGDGPVRPVADGLLPSRSDGWQLCGDDLTKRRLLLDEVVRWGPAA